MSKINKSNRVKLIANPGAGKVADAAKNLALVIGNLEKFGITADVALAKPKEEATPIAKQAVKDGYKTVIVMGGDGTIEAVMRGLMDSKVRLGIIPAGTANNIALSLGIPENLEEACALIASNKSSKLDMGQVKTRNGIKYSFFEMVTVGLSATVYPDTMKVVGGKFSGLRDAALTLIHQETKPTVFLTLDDESKIEVETMLVVVSNTPVFGKNFLAAPNASLQDGLLDISVYPDFSKAELLGYYAKLMDGGVSNDGRVQHYRARKLKIKSTPKLKVLADGTELGKGTITVRMRPGALRVITAEKRPGLARLQKESAKMTPVPVPIVEQTNPNLKITAISKKAVAR